MRPYVALARAAAKAVLAHRLQFVLGILAALVQLVAQLAIWSVLLAAHPVAGFDQTQMRGYVLVAFASTVVVSSFADLRMAYRVWSGSVALDLVKPVDYQAARLAETVGVMWLEVVTIASVCGLVATLGGGFPVPGAWNAMLFGVSIVLVAGTKFLIVYISALACFWTKSYVGVVWARNAIVGLLSGSLIPFSFMPGWFAATAVWLPFAGMCSTPGLLLVGHVSGVRAGLLVGVQFFWLVTLWCGSRLLWRGSLRKLAVHGG